MSGHKFWTHRSGQVIHGVVGTGRFGSVQEFGLFTSGQVKIRSLVLLFFGESNIVNLVMCMFQLFDRFAKALLNMLVEIHDMLFQMNQIAW